MNEKKSIGATFVAWLAWLTRWTTIALIALRAADVIRWPWYALLAPLGLYLVVLLLCVVIIGIGAVADAC